MHYNPGGNTSGAAVLQAVIEHPNAGPAHTRSLSVVIPAYNEAACVARLVEEVRPSFDQLALTGEIVVVDDGSTDGTLEALYARRQVSGLPLRLVRHDRNYGQSTAIHTGIAMARSGWVVMLDADGQNDPADIGRLIDARDRPGPGTPVRLVCGLRARRRDSLVKRLSSRVANGVRSRLLRDGTPDTGCGLKLIHRETFLSLPFFDHMHRFLPALVQRSGGAVLSGPDNHRPRNAGRSKYGLHDRLWVGIVDMFGVAWLQRRSRRPAYREVE
jgi:dolichol-phosphate mannosyltransferase